MFVTVMCIDAHSFYSLLKQPHKELISNKSKVLISIAIHWSVHRTHSKLDCDHEYIDQKTISVFSN